MGKLNDLTGRRFSRLVVIAHVGKTDRNVSLWECACDCGNRIVVARKNLIAGATRSCGCLRKDKLGRRTKHGAARREQRSKLYDIWISMRQRCSNPKSDAWKHYGAKGIKVCPEWEDWPTFRDWALANGYKESLSIDRIESTKGYEPGNCHWITTKENGLKALSNRTN